MKGHRDEIKELYFPIDLEVETNVHVVFETVEPPPPKQRNMQRKPEKEN